MDFRRKSANVLDEKYGRTDEKYAQVIGNIRYFSVSTSYRFFFFLKFTAIVLCPMPIPKRNGTMGDAGACLRRLGKYAPGRAALGASGTPP